jgi:hypothetical protein
MMQFLRQDLQAIRSHRYLDPISPDSHRSHGLLTEAELKECSSLLAAKPSI